MKREGQIKVHSENIFPVIKKWLYSDKDIFLRELVSNASDAIKKLERIGEMSESIKPRIDVFTDVKNKQLKISDNGIGMTENEVEKYITQIAFSGAEEFIEKYKDKTDAESGIIGHFGLGFYSAFMVSDSVEIETLSYEKDAKSVHWKSDGSYTYEIEDGNKKDIGTTVILNVSEDSSEFLDETRIRQMLIKYCQFMPYEIYLNPKNDKDDKPINDTNPLWKKSPKDCTDEEYINFYNKVFFDMNPPLFWIHLNVDYPFNLKGILYFPRQSDKVQVMPGEIKLFSNQVYIADNIKEVVPEFLMLLKGVIDCPDLPLNVSRSFLQNDGDLARISKHITKKVSDKLHSIFKENRDNYEGYWDDISPFIKFGCIKDEKFYDRVKDIIIFKTINDDYKILDDYEKTKDNKIFYVTDESMQAQYISMFKNNNMNAVLLNHAIDQHFISFIEYKEKDISFVRIDSDISDSLKDNEKNKDSKEIIEKFKKHLNKENINIEAENLKSVKMPAIILISEYERRMADMSKLYGDAFGGSVQNNNKIILNLNNDIVKLIPKISDDKLDVVCNYIYDLALITNKQLSADEMSGFIDRSVKILSMIYSEKREG